MNEELQKALGTLLSKANDGIDAASGFLVAELPDVIQQILVWYTVENFIWFSMNLLIMFAAFKGMVKCNKLRIEFIHDMWEIPMVLLGVVCAATPFISIVYLVESLKIFIAPKLWLLEYAAKLAG